MLYSELYEVVCVSGFNSVSLMLIILLNFKFVQRKLKKLLLLTGIIKYVILLNNFKHTIYH